MPTPYGWSPTKLSSLALEANAKALIFGEQWASNTISFSFATASSKWSTDPDTGYGPSNGSGEPWNGVSELLSTQKTLVKDALASWAAVAKLDFVEVAETNSKVGDLRFAFSDGLEEGVVGQAYLPSEGASAGDVWFNGKDDLMRAYWNLGSYEYMAVIHEIGHALGLKHPFETSPYNDVVAPPAWDNRSYSLMSYAAQAGKPETHFDYEPTTPMLLDIEALQHMYGANMSWHPGDDTYEFAGRIYFHETIWDAGGVDTISIRQLSYEGSVIDLREGHGSRFGHEVNVIDAYGRVVKSVDNVWIAYGAVIENAIGTGLDDVLVGNAADNLLDGGFGTDRMVGGNGSDTYLVRDTGDVVIESAGSAAGRHDKVISTADDYTLPANVEDGEVGAAGVDSLVGNALANRIIAGGMFATLDGRAGIDTVDYSEWGSNASVNLTTHELQQISDSNWNVLRNFENLVGSAYDDRLTGDAGPNRIEGLAGNDILDGGAGNDVLIGGFGNDFYVVNSAGDVVTETSKRALEIDSVRALVSWTLGANLEKLVLGGAAAISGTGNALANTLTGNAAANVLDGGAGADTMIGGRGNDTYVVESAGDIVIETSTAATEIDTVRSSVSRVLGNYQEDLTLTGSAAIDGIGNRWVNTLTGNAAANTLNAGAGDDILLGGRGNDTLIGGPGNDTMAGGLGNDTLNGGAGLDIFRFTTMPDATTNADILKDFLASDDRIELESAAFAGIGPAGALSAVRFHAGAAAHDASDRIIYDQAAGKLYFDADGNQAGAQVLFASLAAGTALTASDLFVI